MVKCACGGTMVAVYDHVQELPRIKCDNPYHGRVQHLTPNPPRRKQGPTIEKKLLGFIYGKDRMSKEGL